MLSLILKRFISGAIVVLVCCAALSRADAAVFWPTLRISIDCLLLVLTFL